MNKLLKLSTVSAMSIASLFVVAAASATDGTITISGKVQDASCDAILTGNAGTNTLTLPTVSKTTLAAPASVAGRTSFGFDLTGCPVSGKVRSYFESTNVDPSTGSLMNNAVTPAGNVQVQILDDVSGVAIDLRDNTNNSWIDLTTGAATLNYSAQYIATAAATAGDVETQLVYTLQYQ